MVPPSQCAELLKNGDVDLSLVPLGAIDEIPNAEIVTNYGIACDGEVRTVCIFSNSPLENINTLFLDAHSRTSQKLALILLRTYMGFNIKSEIIEIAQLRKLNGSEGVLMIGDKVFDNETRYKYKYDLGLEWKKYTGLPFVFAVWMQNAKKPVGADLLNMLNTEFSKDVLGLDVQLQVNNIDTELSTYLKRNISYDLSKSMKMGMQLFMEKMNKLETTL